MKPIKNIFLSACHNHVTHGIDMSFANQYILHIQLQYLPMKHDHPQHYSNYIASIIIAFKKASGVIPLIW